ncbi:hypothetical protein DI272_18895 [Streptomyces sp. Act143]|uniref:hypothetical protein n=1 Tax=Streptomyces sp. Act143 TaxID=2200760 RepID=UPI000D67FB77|nr:hypothetical protein [Streptomyces sp. Act143]PWI16001.1 hypothetical protein DI272_18895 [Streptomyces sp. Act143]
MATRPTPAQMRALALIAGGRVRLIQAGLGSDRIDSPDGPVASSTLDVLVRERWVQASGPVSQPLDLTAVGQSFLPDRTPDIEAPTSPRGSLGDLVLAKVMRKAIRSGDVAIDMHATSIDFVVGDDELLYRLGGSFATVDELASFLGLDPADITDAR